MQLTIMIDRSGNIRVYDETGTEKDSFFTVNNKEEYKANGIPIDKVLLISDYSMEGAKRLIHRDRSLNFYYYSAEKDVDDWLSFCDDELVPLFGEAPKTIYWKPDKS